MVVDYALRYAAKGWHVLPIHSRILTPDGEPRCSCGRVHCASAAKHPIISNGLKAATTEPAIIEKWWKKWPSANVAIRTGRISGLAVVDVDGANGMRTLQKFVDNCGKLRKPRGLVKTARGHHFYYELAESLATRPETNGNGLGIRADGAYVVAPPSVHLSGHVYQWVTL